jgi:hypothetical protein
MASLHRTAVTLRLFGDDLDPNEITELLGAEPTSAAAKGGVLKSAKGVERVARTGSWRLKAADHSPGNIDAQVDQILSGLTNDLAAWRDLTERFSSDIFCGLFMQAGNEGLELRPETMASLGSRGLRLGLDVYGSSADE